ncbi:MAG: methyltransferase domain-containing protein [Nitrospira sp.]|nr:methyltransferase domain-containing protein [Nitrospira sp.]
MVLQGALVCAACHRTFPIVDGILNLLNDRVLDLDEESRYELAVRDQRAVNAARAKGAAWYDNECGRAEFIPTVHALSVEPDTTVLELGCGDGRYTLPLAGQCQWVIAVDFSLESLRNLQRRRQEHRNIALVCADITTLRIMPKSCDRVLATLVSNLPSPIHREAMFLLAASAMKTDGRFVFSTHFHGLWRQLTFQSQAGRYEESDIYRYYFTMRECHDEVRKYFSAVTVRPIQFCLPLAGMLGLPLTKISRILEGIPIVNLFGQLLLCTAEQPIQDASQRQCS